MKIGLTAIGRLVCEEIMEWHHQGGEEITFDLRVLFSVNLPFDVRSKETCLGLPSYNGLWPTDCLKGGMKDILQEEEKWILQ